MEGQLKPGTVVTSENGIRYTVVSMLGAGGQGEVYDVMTGGRHFAMKWYYPKMATQSQKEILEKLIARGAPDKSFLWPEELIYTSPGESFGYIMPLRPTNYRGVVDLMKRTAEPSFFTLCLAAYNLTKSYQKLHADGYSYRDISFGNVFFDPDTGDVLIADNDNVAANGIDNSSVSGTPRFMAPEIVRGEAAPSRNTDLYSLAVLLFYMLMLNHPLDGRIEADIKCMDMHAMLYLYGTNPIFIFDPHNRTNRPKKGYQDNALIYWDLYPAVIRDLFTESFTVGLVSPNRRVTETQWLDALSNLMTGIMNCPNCGAEVFFDPAKVSAGVSHTCWLCQTAVRYPASLVTGKSRVLLTKGAKLYSHSIHGDYDMNTVVGEVVQNPNNPALWGIMNLTHDNWTYIKSDNQQIPVAEGRSATIAKGAKICFGELTGEFE